MYPPKYNRMDVKVEWVARIYGVDDPFKEGALGEIHDEILRGSCNCQSVKKLQHATERAALSWHFVISTGAQAAQRKLNEEEQNASSFCGHCAKYDWPWSIFFRRLINYVYNNDMSFLFIILMSTQGGDLDGKVCFRSQSIRRRVLIHFEIPSISVGAAAVHKLETQNLATISLFHWLVLYFIAIFTQFFLRRKMSNVKLG